MARATTRFCDVLAVRGQRAWVAALSASVVLASAGPSSAQWVPAGNLSVVNSVGSVVPDDSGNALVLWNTNFSHIDTGGAQLFQRSSVCGGNAVADGVGGMVGTLQTSSALLASRLSSTALQQWGTGCGVTLETVAPLFHSIAPDGVGGFVAAWLRNGNTLKVQRLRGDGVAQWTAGGVLVTAAAASNYPHAMAPDGAGGLYVFWISAGLDAYGQRYDSLGTALWAAGGIPICTAPGAQEYPVAIADGFGNAIVAWWDSRGGTRDVFAQRVNGAGSGLWGTNGALVSAAAFDQLLPVLAPDGTGGAFVAWEDHRPGYNDGLDIYAQRMAANGAPQWAADGVPVCTASNPQIRPAVVGDGAGGIVVAWHDQRFTYSPSCPDCGYQLFAQRLNGSGAPMWMANGVQVHTSTLNTSPGGPPKLIADGQGGCFSASSMLGRVTPVGEPAWYENFRARVTSVVDEPSDEGGYVQVRMHWAWGDSISGGTPLVTGYTVWRRVTPGAEIRSRDASPLSATGAGVPPGFRTHLDGAFGFPAGDWVAIAYVPSFGIPEFKMLAPTASDSTADGPANAEFVVTSQLDAPPHLVTTPSAFGHSVDNLAPSIPAPLAGGRVAETSVRLVWPPNVARDLAYFTVHRGGSPSFTPSPANRIAVTTRATYTDDAFVPGTSHYKVAAVDRHGNVSAYSSLAPGEIGSTPPGSIPTVSFLGRPTPNPSRDGVAMELGLATAGRVTMAVFDAKGRRIRRLDEDRPAGSGFLWWNGRDVAGRRAAPGLYWIRTDAIGLQSLNRVVIVQ